MKTEFIKIVVIDVIFDPMIMSPDRIKYYESLGLIPNNFVGKLPRNTVLGKQILESKGNSGISPLFFFPFFPPHLSLPCKPGEHMWALLDNTEYGYWFCRITETASVDDLNHTHPPRAFEPTFTVDKKSQISGINTTPVFDFTNGLVATDTKGTRFVLEGSNFFSLDGVNIENTYSYLVNKDINQINASKLTPGVAVPRYKKRPGDISLEGSNNTLIVLGTDRNGAAAEYKEIEIETEDGNLNVKTPVYPTADLPYGSIDIVAGRGQTLETSGESVQNSLQFNELNKVANVASKYPNEGNPDLINDRSRIRLSEKSKVDASLQIEDFNLNNFTITDSADGDGAIVIKSDKLRFIARKDVEIMVAMDGESQENYAAVVIKSDGSIVFKPSSKGYVKLGGDDADKALLCTDYSATKNNGSVSASGPLGAVIITNDGSSFGSGAPNRGTVASKILVK